MGATSCLLNRTRFLHCFHCCPTFTLTPQTQRGSPPTDSISNIVLQREITSCNYRVRGWRSCLMWTHRCSDPDSGFERSISRTGRQLMDQRPIGRGKKKRVLLRHNSKSHSTSWVIRLGPYLLHTAAVSQWARFYHLFPSFFLFFLFFLRFHFNFFSLTWPSPSLPICVPSLRHSEWRGNIDHLETWERIEKSFSFWFKMSLISLSLSLSFPGSRRKADEKEKEKSCCERWKGEREIDAAECFCVSFSVLFSPEHWRLVRMITSATIGFLFPIRDSTV